MSASNFTVNVSNFENVFQSIGMDAMFCIHFIVVLQELAFKSIK